MRELLQELRANIAHDPNPYYREQLRLATERYIEMSKIDLPSLVERVRDAVDHLSKMELSSMRGEKPNHYEINSLREEMQSLLIQLGGGEGEEE